MARSLYGGYGENGYVGQDFLIAVHFYLFLLFSLLLAFYFWGVIGGYCLSFFTDLTCSSPQLLSARTSPACLYSFPKVAVDLYLFRAFQNLFSVYFISALAHVSNHYHRLRIMYFVSFSEGVWGYEYRIAYQS